MRIDIDKEGGFDLCRAVMTAIVGRPMQELTLIDLCSCEATVTRNLPFREKTYVDVGDWDIPEQMDRYIKADVLGDHPCFDKRYDVATCLDGIEHFTKENGFKLIERMKKISDVQILFTPLGDYLVGFGDQNDPNTHKSGWLPEDFKGFGVIVAKNFHKTLGIGAFWAWNSPDIKNDFARVSRQRTKWA